MKIVLTVRNEQSDLTICTDHVQDVFVLDLILGDHTTYFVFEHFQSRLEFLNLVIEITQMCALRILPEQQEVFGHHFQN